MSRRLLVLLCALLTCAGDGADAPVEPPAPGGGYWGVAIGAYPWEAQTRGFDFPPDMAELRRLNASDVLIPVSYHQQTVRSSAVASGPHTIADHDLRRLIRDAHENDLRTILVPIIEVDHGGPTAWRGVIAPADDDLWWASYRDYVRRYAAIAQEERVGLFVIGSELTSMSGKGLEDEWEAIAMAVREDYSGPLAYCANHDGLDRHAPFAHVDYAAVSAYFPLADQPDAAAVSVSARAREAVASVLALGSKVDLPVLLLEVGYPSVDGALMHPWDQTTSAPIDLAEQALGYRAMVDAVLTSEQRVEGVLFWNWFGPGGAHDRYFTPRGKPAEAQLQRLLQAR